MTTIDPHALLPTVVSNPRVASNTAEDFLEWVESLIALGHLVSGDIFICDNASVHAAADIQERLDSALDGAGVTLYFLPTYSPELNPCELVFAQLKQWIRRNRSGGALWQDILDALGTVSYTNVLAYYAHCISIGEGQAE